MVRTAPPSHSIEERILFLRGERVPVSRPTTTPARPRSRLPRSWRRSSRSGKAASLPRPRHSDRTARLMNPPSQNPATYPASRATDPRTAVNSRGVQCIIRAASKCAHPVRLVVVGPAGEPVTIGAGNVQGIGGSGGVARHGGRDRALCPAGGLRAGRDGHRAPALLAQPQAALIARAVASRGAFGPHESVIAIRRAAPRRWPAAIPASPLPGARAARPRARCARRACCAAGCASPSRRARG